MGKTTFTAALLTLGLVGLAGTVRAEPSFPGVFAAKYPSATRLDTCGLCHRNFIAFGSLNPYGTAFGNAGGLTNPTAALTAIEALDSDGDGTSNLSEIMTASGFYPGYTCDTYTNTFNEPADLADYVDPARIGCLTTTTLPPTTTSTTTLAPPACAQPLSTGPAPIATDCLFILRAAVGLATCDPACVCAPKGALPVSATDALICLKKAVGQAVALNCPC